MKIQINEINMQEVILASESLASFNPIKCLTCGNKKDIVQRFFELNISAESEYMHKKIKKELRDKYGLTYYGFWEGNSKVITVGKCPECDGEKMFWD